MTIGTAQGKRKMTAEEKKDWLRRYCTNALEIERLRDEIARWRSLAEYGGSAFFAGGGGGGGRHDRMADAVERMVLLEDELATQLCVRVKRRREIERAVETVADEGLRVVLRMRYINGMNFDSIAERLYSQWQGGPKVRWVRTEMAGVSWHGGPGAAAGFGGPRPAGRWAVRIPEGAMPPGYAAPGEWQRLDDPAGRWCLQPGDVLAKGHGLPDVLGGISEITGGLAECFVVDSVKDNRRGAGALRHLRAEGGG